MQAIFPEVQTAEEARQDIQRRKPSAGREKKNAIYSAVAYGIYRMLHEENAIPSQPNMPNELCQLIHDYTRVTGCYPNNKGERQIRPESNPRRPCRLSETSGYEPSTTIQTDTIAKTGYHAGF